MAVAARRRRSRSAAPLRRSSSTALAPRAADRIRSTSRILLLEAAACTSAASASPSRRAGRSPRATRPRPPPQETAVPALPDRQRVGSSVQGGFFLIEAMVAILIFALGILGLVAMGGTAVSSQSDAQYRTEAAGLADSIASEIALNITRVDESTKAATLAAFAHQPSPAPTGTPACVFDTAGAITATAATQGVVNLLNRAANLSTA